MSTRKREKPRTDSEPSASSDRAPESPAAASGSNSPTRKLPSTGGATPAPNPSTAKKRGSKLETTKKRGKAGVSTGELFEAEKPIPDATAVAVSSDPILPASPIVKSIEPTPTQPHESAPDKEKVPRQTKRFKSPETARNLTMAEVAEHLEHIAKMIGLVDDNSFRVRAYETAARNLNTVTGRLKENLESGKLKNLDGVGDSILEKLEQLAATGRIEQEVELHEKIPGGVIDMLKVSGLGPKKVRTIWQSAGIVSLAALEQACKDGKIATLPGFGEKTQANILDGITQMRKYASRFHQDTAMREAAKVETLLKSLPAVKRFAAAGSLRRRMETIGDLDFVTVVAEKDVPSVMDAFCKMAEVEKVLVQGATKSSVIMGSGMQVDLRTVREDEFPFALAYFTGSKQHNIEMRRRAIERGLRLNEYALTRDDGSRVPCKDETEIFKALGLKQFVPPELREDFGEFQAAENGELPELVTDNDLKGLFHMHTVASDGACTLERTAELAMARGYQYIGITDHSQTAAYARGLEPHRLLKQIDEIDALNAKLKGQLRIFKGTESDILLDGSLDYSDEVLSRLDFVVASVHAGFQKNEKLMTERVIKAIENPFTTMLGHLTGRLLLSRDGYPLDIEAVLQACMRTGCVVEINSNPYRLELDWRSCKRAKELGVKISINPDAHSEEGFVEHPHYGVGMERKGWLTTADVVNTWPLEKVEAFLKARRKRG